MASLEVGGMRWCWWSGGRCGWDAAVEWSWPQVAVAVAVVVGMASLVALTAAWLSQRAALVVADGCR
jgi:hypothetical protein